MCRVYKKTRSVIESIAQLFQIGKLKSRDSVRVYKIDGQ